MLQYWYFHLPNYVLAVAMYTLLGRLVLSYFFGPDSENFIWRAFCRLTNLIMRVVAFVTPRSAPPVVLILFSFLWILILRQGLRLAMVLGNFVPLQPVAG